MFFQHLRRVAFVLVCASFMATAAKADETTRVLLIVGPSTHKPGTHEVEAGSRLLADCLQNATNLPGLECKVVVGWPEDKELLRSADTMVFSGDRFPLAEMDNTEKNMAELAEQMDRGCGLVCYHYATGLTKGQMPDDGTHPLLDWMGGYFATRCVHHQGTARIYEKAHIEINKKHPILRGVSPFTINDEPYINNYFGPNGIERNVTPLMTSMLPPESPKPEIVAWAVERTLPDQSLKQRGMAIVMPHFYRNWENDDLRTSILNGVAWTAHREVPHQGVSAPRPKLDAYGAESVLPAQKNREK